MPTLRAATIAPLAASLLLVTLTSACDKPVPGVTVQSGSGSVRAEASCWGRTATKPVSIDACVGKIVKLKVTPGQPIGISVDKSVADAGWEPVVGTNGLVAKPVHDSYYRFAVSEQDLASGPVALRVIALDKTGKQPRGLWTVSIDRS